MMASCQRPATTSSRGRASCFGGAATIAGASWSGSASAAATGGGVAGGPGSAGGGWGGGAGGAGRGGGGAGGAARRCGGAAPREPLQPLGQRLQRELVLRVAHLDERKLEPQARV